MSTLSEQTESEPELKLEPVLSARWALSWRHLLVCIWFGAFGMMLNYEPLYYTDLWSHVQYGHWILDHRALPTEDVFMPLAEGMPLVDSAWLSQAIFAQVDYWGGHEGLSTLYALTMLAAYAIFSRAFYLLTGRISLSLGGMALALFIGWPRYLVMRPEIFGLLAFAILFWLVVRENRLQAFDDDATSPEAPAPWDRWLPFVGVPVLFVAWANLHGSFPVGIVLLGCYFLGRLIDVAWRTRDVQAVIADRGLRRWLVLGELALAATLINPYGMDLLISTVRFSQNPNLKDILEWYPLKLVDLEGLECVAGWILLIVVLRHSRRRVTAAEILLLLIFTAAVAKNIRMIAWFSPVLVLVMLPHAADILQRYFPKRIAAPSESEQPVSGNLSFRYSLLSLLVIWMCFAFSPMSQPVLGGKVRKTERLYSSQTPYELTDWLQKNPPQGQIWNPQWWGDWLRLKGPADMKVFVTSQIHLIPPYVWQDYLRVFNMTGSWQQTLQRYRVTTMVIDKRLQPRLSAIVRREPNWKVAYEDDKALVMKFSEKAGSPELSPNH